MSNRIARVVAAISRYKLLSGGTGLAAAASLPTLMRATLNHASPLTRAKE